MIHALSDYRLPGDLKGTYLEAVVEDKLRAVVGARSKWPAASIEISLDRAPTIRSFKKALMSRSPAIIAEIKKASPSAGLLRRDFDPLKIGQEYQAAGAAAISVVTEVRHFRGGLETLAAVRWNSRIPLLRKDFIIDSYQVLEARHAGADAVLLIAALHDVVALRALRAEAEAYRMDVMFEVHSRSDLDKAMEVGATIVGVNNRDLRSFEVSLDVCADLAPCLPPNAVAVAESGLRTAEDIRRLADLGYRGFLIGEKLLSAPSPGRALSELISALSRASRRVA